MKSATGEATAELVALVREGRVAAFVDRAWNLRPADLADRRACGVAAARAAEVWSHWCRRDFAEQALIELARGAQLMVAKAASSLMRSDLVDRE